MISFELDTTKRILHILPEGQLEQDDFVQLTQAIDPFIEERGALKGIMIETRTFPGWENLASMLEHFKFVKNHHEDIQKVALVTDSKVADIAETLVNHFVQAEIRHFPFFEKGLAEAWLEQEL